MCSTGLGGQRTVPKELFRDFRKTKIGNHCVGKARFRYEGKRPNYLVHKQAASDGPRRPGRPQRASKAAAGPRQPTTRNPSSVQAKRAGSSKGPTDKAPATPDLRPDRRPRTDGHGPQRPPLHQRLALQLRCPPPSQPSQPTIVRTSCQLRRKPEPAAQLPLPPLSATAPAAPPMAARTSALREEPSE